MAVSRKSSVPSKSPICANCKGAGFVCSTRIVIEAGKSIEYDFSQKCPICRPRKEEGQQ